MKSITQEGICNLPLHDSTFIGYKVFKDTNNLTELILSFSFYEEEYKDLEWDHGKPEQNASFIVHNCILIKSDMNYNRVPSEDYIDYVEIIANSPLLDKYSTRSVKHIKIVLISGSWLECVAEELFFQFGSLF